MPREESAQHHASHFYLFIISAGRRLSFTTLTLNVTETGPGCKPEQQDGADCCTVTPLHVSECTRARVCLCYFDWVGAMRTLIDYYYY